MLLDTEIDVRTVEPGAVAAPGDAVHRLADAWREAGIGDGDLVLIHSSLKRTLRRLLKQQPLP